MRPILDLTRIEPGEDIIPCDHEQLTEWVEAKKYALEKWQQLRELMLSAE